MPAIKKRSVIPAEIPSITTSLSIHFRGLLEQPAAGKPHSGTRGVSRFLSIGDDVDPSKLFHQLSYIFEEKHGPPCAALHGELEFAVFKELLSSFSSHAVGLSDLTTLNRLLVPKSAVRSRPVHLFRNNSERIELPDSADAISNLIKCLDEVSNNPAADGFAKAIFEYVAINNSHIFEDGNGRTSRVLLAIRFAQLLKNNDFIYFKSFFIRAKGAHELCLREAELFARWQPLYDLLMRIALMAHKMPV